MGADSVFKHVKRVCESYKSDPARLTTYINDYISDLYKFAEAYAGLLVHIETSKEYQQYFLYMQFTATLYPLIVRLYEQKKLDALLPILETTEMRVYKLKNTNPHPIYIESTKKVIKMG